MFKKLTTFYDKKPIFINMNSIRYCLSRKGGGSLISFQNGDELCLLEEPEEIYLLNLPLNQKEKASMPKLKYCPNRSKHHDGVDFCLRGLANNTGDLEPCDYCNFDVEIKEKIIEDK